MSGTESREAARSIKEEKRMTNMEKLDAFLAEAGVFYLSTVDGDTPKCRPLGLHQLIDGKIYYGVGDFKSVYKQLLANPKAEIVALKGSSWVRVNGKAVIDEDDGPAATEIMKTFPLKKLYEENGWTLKVFHLEEAEVQFIDLMTVKEDFSI